MMSEKARLANAEVRLHNLENNGKNFDSPGVVKKLKRKIKLMKAREEK